MGVERVAVWGGVGVPEDEEIVCIAVACCEVIGQDIHSCVVEYTFDDKVWVLKVVVVDDCVLFCEGNIIDNIIIFVYVGDVFHEFPFLLRVFVRFHCTRWCGCGVVVLKTNCCQHEFLGEYLSTH